MNDDISYKWLFMIKHVFLFQAQGIKTLL